MSKQPYVMPALRALPEPKVPEPHVAKHIILLAKIFARLYLFLFFGVARTILKGKSEFFGAFKRALAGQSRCIIAFRHPNGGEPQLLSWFILFKLKGLARRNKVRFARSPHAVFVYGYEVIRWGGAVAGLIMPRLGAMPIYHSKIDSKGLGRIYRAIAGGPWPVAIAPEGQVSYTTDSIPRLEQGAVRIGFFAAERIKKSGDDIPVELLPVSFHYRFGPWGRFFLESLIKKIEKFTGFAKQKGKGGLPFRERVEPCRDYILRINEKRYHLAPPEDGSLSFSGRVDAVIEAALRRAEEILGVKSEGDTFAKLYFLRQVSWDRIVLPGKESLDDLSPVERAVLDLRAGEAWHAGRHLELVDFSWYFRGPIPEEDSPLHSKVEFVQNLWDFANRSMGGAYSNRINLFPKRMIIQAAPVINLSERLPDWHTDKRAAIEAAMGDLKAAFLDCIKKVDEPEV